MEGDQPGPVRGHRRGPRWEAVGWGLHRPVPAVQCDDPWQAERARRLLDLQAWALVLPPSGRFTHLSAATAYDWWTPPLPPDLPVLAAMTATGPRPRRRGLSVCRLRSLAEPLVRRGLPVDPPAQTLLACARHLGILDLVVLVDAALHAGDCTPTELEAAVAPRTWGAPRLRAALALADGRSESPYETLLRLLHVTCGIHVEPQYQLRTEDGLLVARADLWLIGTNVLHEYDGADHLGRRRQRKDLRRAARVNNIEWIRRGYTAEEVLHQSLTILREADLSLGRPHEPSRIRAWHRLLVESTFTPAGVERLRRRLGLITSSSGGKLQA